MTFANVLRRALLYLGLAFASLSVLALVFAISLRTHIVVPFPWAMLVAFTALLIWIEIKASRRYWSRPIFWLTVAIMLCIHLAVFIAILRSYPDFRPFWFVPATIVEAGAFGAICGVLLDGSNARRRKHTSRP